MSSSRPTKSAALTLFAFGDDPIRTLVQNAQVNLQYCIDGYDRSVVLKDEFVSLGQTRPDLVLSPGGQLFVEQVRELAATDHYIDIFLFAHGSRGRISIPGSDNDITEEFLLEELSRDKTGRNQLPIRSVYQMNCYGQTLNQTWVDLGAKVVCGARFINFYPNQFNAFAREWVKGDVPFFTALRESNTDSSRTVMQTLIAADALVHPGSTRCQLLSTVLSDSPCAKSYFKDRWFSSDSDWQDGMSGKDNMNYSSYMFRTGSNLPRNDIPLAWHP
jgi:hypothetical protein